ncbi:hypothetical protein PoB_000946100 [Plakobranchus ocellatus]|uniref:Uncharacterized protein n=1 Tax=Plakobranchus ocellatus TaxID=259542 RepID=A0AAV3Y6S8_9GAST|nr:hypothetical protein PoB_000946100 [Plakobranchus ocellatus]
MSCGIFKHKDRRSDRWSAALLFDQRGCRDGLLGPPSGQGAGSRAQTHDRRVPADLRADSLTTVPQTPLEMRIISFISIGDVKIVMTILASVD